MGEYPDTPADESERSTVGVIGAGTMGVGVAQCLAQAGHRVVVTDPDAQAVAAGPERLRQGLRLSRLLRGSGRADAASLPAEGAFEGRGSAPAGDAASLVTWSTQPEGLAAASFVVECAREHLEIKREVLRRADGLCGPDTVIASCTSAIAIELLGSFTGRPDRVLGMHFMNPAPLKDAVEVVRSPQTSEATLTRALDLLDGMGKHGIVVGDGPGFVSNRVLMLTLNEAASVVGAGTADASAVDRVFQECFGHSMGPLRTADLIGLDTVVDSLDVLRAQTGDEKFRPCALLSSLVAAGHTGTKSGRGFFRHPRLSAGAAAVPAGPRAADQYAGNGAGEGAGRG